MRPTEPQSSGPSSSTRVGELEEEVQQLRDQLVKAKGVNDAMWEVVVQKLLSPEKPAEAQVSMDVEQPGSDRSRKRARK